MDCAAPGTVCSRLHLPVYCTGLCGTRHSLQSTSPACVLDCAAPGTVCSRLHLPVYCPGLCGTRHSLQSTSPACVVDCAARGTVCSWFHLPVRLAQLCFISLCHLEALLLMYVFCYACCFAAGAVWLIRYVMTTMTMCHSRVVFISVALLSFAAYESVFLTVISWHVSCCSLSPDILIYGIACCVSAVFLVVCFRAVSCLAVWTFQYRNLLWYLPFHPAP